jgi:cell division cycle 14
MLEKKLKDPKLAGKRIIHCCSSDLKARSNAAYLICSYLVIVQRQPAEAAFSPFIGLEPPLLGYRDATASSRVSFELTVKDCLDGLEASLRARLFDWERFSAETYEFFSRVENGDANWILPDKFLAFAGPYPTPVDEDGFKAFTPEDYVPMFLDAGIRMVIRLNRKNYDRQKFIDKGIKHVDLYFPDGTCPSREIITRFLNITESEPGPCAVHCKAGLGRTGTLIGLYAMKHHRIPARAFIGWNRICRPGSILGAQQQFLVDMEAAMFQAGDMMKPIPTARLSLAEAANSKGYHEQNMNPLPFRELAEDELTEDVNQGERLCKAKREADLGGPINGHGYDSYMFAGTPSHGTGGTGAPPDPFYYSGQHRHMTQVGTR